MLSVFMIDEYAIFGHILSMIHQDGPFQISKFLFKVYYYGYPYFFFSALAALPARLVEMWDPLVNLTKLEIWSIRQFEVLCILFSAFLCVQIPQIKISRSVKVSIFTLLLFIPCVFEKNTNMHPDSLSTLFLVLTLYFISRDKYQLGNFFWYSIATCAIAISVKKLGLFFIPSYLFYLILATRSKRIPLLRLLKISALSVSLTAGIYIITTPYLLSPTHLSQATSILWEQANAYKPTSVSERNLIENIAAWWTPMREGDPDPSMTPKDEFYAPISSLGLKYYLGHPMVILSLLILLAFAFPFAFIFVVIYSIYVLCFVNLVLSYWYFTHIALIIYGLGLLSLFELWQKHTKSLGRALVATGAAILLFQFGHFFSTIYHFHRFYSQPNNQFPAVASWQSQSPLIFKLAKEIGYLQILRSSYTYVEISHQFQSENRWRQLSLHDLQGEKSFDIVILERKNVENCSGKNLKSCLRRQPEGEHKAIQEFNQLAAANSVPGFTQIYSDDYSLMLLNNNRLQK